MSSDAGAAIATADLMDRGGGRACAVQWRSFGGRLRFAGEIVTVDCFEDNGLVRGLVAEPGGGRVLVVDGHGSLAAALVGDQVAGRAVANGWAGLVVNGAVRDVAGLAELDLGVFALGSNPARCARRGAGTITEPLRFGGVEFVGGHFLAADPDGVAVFARRPPEFG